MTSHPSHKVIGYAKPGTRLPDDQRKGINKHLNVIYKVPDYSKAWEVMLQRFTQPAKLDNWNVQKEARDEYGE